MVKIINSCLIKRIFKLSYMMIAFKILLTNYILLRSDQYEEIKNKSLVTKEN